MKVYIGPYRNRLTFPYKVTDWYFAKRFGDYDYSDKDYNLADRVVENIANGVQYVLNKCINEPWLDKRGRDIRVRIDGYDVWGADHTLALIIHPVLLKLKSVKHGSPFVDDEDVPEHLRSAAAPPKANDWDIDDNHELRWDWVLDEMLWAFEQCSKEDSGSDQFYSGNMDWVFVKDEESGLSEITDGPKNTFKVDRVGRDAHYDRIKNGHRLFGKYYFSLWD